MPKEKGTINWNEKLDDLEGTRSDKALIEVLREIAEWLARICVVLEKKK